MENKLLKALKSYFAKQKERKNCSHYWELYDIVPVMDRDGYDERQDVYKIRCLKCSKSQQRSFFGIDRLQKLGRIAKNPETFDAAEMAAIVYKCVEKARGEGLE